MIKQFKKSDEGKIFWHRINHQPMLLIGVQQTSKGTKGDYIRYNKGVMRHTDFNGDLVFADYFACEFNASEKKYGTAED